MFTGAVKTSWVKERKFFQNIVTAVRQEIIDTAFDGGDRCCGGQCPPYEKTQN